MRAPPRRPPSRTFRSLQYPNFRRFAAGQLISQVGTWMQAVVVGIVVLQLTDSGVALGLVTLAQFGPMLLLGPWAGLLVDRLDLHRLLLAVNGAGAVLAALFAAVVLSGDPPLWAVYLLTTATGITFALENPVRRVFVTELVDDDLLPNATSLNSTVMIGSEAVGLALAGVLVGAFGPGACFAFNAASYIPQLVLFARMDRRALRRQPRLGRARGQTREGIDYARRSPHIPGPLLLLAALGMFGFTAHAVVVPLLAVRDLGGDERTYTALLTAVSVGALAGALASARRNAVDMAAAARGAIAFGVLQAVLGLAPSVWVAAVVALPVGYTSMVVVAAANAGIQLRTPPFLRGRVMSLVSMVLMGGGALGGPIVGWVAEVAGAPASLALSGALAASAGGIVLFGGRRRAGDRDAQRTRRIPRSNGCDDAAA